MSRMLAIDVYFDLICPWCLIGRRHLTTAVQRFAGLHPDVAIVVDWHSYPLLPGTPAEGVPYQSFYEERLGGREAVAARRAQVQEAARAANIEFAFDRIRVLPNTLAAHRLIDCCARLGSAAQRESLIDALFAAYFLRGEDIGERRVLARVAAECGFAGETVAAWHGSDEASQWVPELAPSHVSGVPCHVFNGRLSASGAHRPEVLLDVMEQAILAPAAGRPAPSMKL